MKTEIEHKYDIGDEVWYIDFKPDSIEKQAYHAIVIRATFYVWRHTNDYINYLCQSIKSGEFCGGHGEEDLYDSEESALKSLNKEKL